MSRHVAAVVAAAVRGMTGVMTKWQGIATRAQIAANLVPRAKIKTAHGTLSFYIPSKTAVFWARYGFITEPDTLRWLDAMPAGSVLWDIGASVGIYSLYAAARGDLSVRAFEANPLTYHCLLMNTRDNGFEERLKPYCLALAGTSSLGSLYIESLEAGTVGNAFGDPEASLLREHAGRIEVPMLSVSIDELAEKFGASFPSHVKLDVDGIEEQIITGGAKVLSDPRVRSVLMELHRDIAQPGDRVAAIIARMQSYGFRIADDDRGNSVNCIFVRA